MGNNLKKQQRRIKKRKQKLEDSDGDKPSKKKELGKFNRNAVDQGQQEHLIE